MKVKRSEENEKGIKRRFILRTRAGCFWEFERVYKVFFWRSIEEYSRPLLLYFYVVFGNLLKGGCFWCFS